MKAKPVNKDLYVTDISFEVEEEELRKLFSVCGTIRNLHMVTDQKSGLFKGIAYVRMATAAEAKDALVTLDGALLGNRCIRVVEARPKSAAVKPAEPVAEKSGRSKRPPGRRK